MSSGQSVAAGTFAVPGVHGQRQPRRRPGARTYSDLRTQACSGYFWLASSSLFARSRSSSLERPPAKLPPNSSTGSPESARSIVASAPAEQQCHCALPAHHNRSCDSHQPCLLERGRHAGPDEALVARAGATVGRAVGNRRLTWLSHLGSRRQNLDHVTLPRRVWARRSHSSAAQMSETSGLPGLRNPCKSGSSLRRAGAS